MKMYKSVVKPLSPSNVILNQQSIRSSLILNMNLDAAKMALAKDLSPSTSHRSFSSNTKNPKAISTLVHNSSNPDIASTAGYFLLVHLTMLFTCLFVCLFVFLLVHPFNKGHSQTVHNQQKMISAIGNNGFDC